MRWGVAWHWERMFCQSLGLRLTSTPHAMGETVTSCALFFFTWPLINACMLFISPRLSSMQVTVTSSSKKMIAKLQRKEQRKGQAAGAKGSVADQDMELLQVCEY